MNTTPSTQDFEKNIAFYSDLLEKYGIDVKSLDWRSRESQEMRFKILSQLTDLNDKSILDVGCGLGDLYGWLEKNNIKTNYKGIDITSKMIEKAKERFVNTDFELMNILVEKPSIKVDCILASGIFVYQNQYFLEEFIQKSFAITNHSLGFNSLNSLIIGKEENKLFSVIPFEVSASCEKITPFYANPFEILDFCKKITPWVTLRMDYDARDFTIYMYKEKNI